MFRFRCGPHDGAEFDVATINAIAHTFDRWTESGNLTFLVMPATEDIEGIKRGDFRKGFGPGRQHQYVRIAMDQSGVTFQEVTESGPYSMANMTRPEEPLDEALARKALFDQRADQFIARIQSEGFGNGVGVELVYVCIDEDGSAVRVPRDLTPGTRVNMGHQDASRRLAEGLLVGMMIDNINSVVRAAPTGFFRIANGPSHAVQI
jgi:hypothetical protein